MRNLSVERRGVIGADHNTAIQITDIPGNLLSTRDLAEIHLFALSVPAPSMEHGRGLNAHTCSRNLVLVLERSWHARASICSTAKATVVALCTACIYMCKMSNVYEYSFNALCISARSEHTASDCCSKLSMMLSWSSIKPSLIESSAPAASSRRRATKRWPSTVHSASK